MTDITFWTIRIANAKRESRLYKLWPLNVGRLLMAELIDLRGDTWRRGKPWKVFLRAFPKMHEVAK